MQKTVGMAKYMGQTMYSHVLTYCQKYFFIKVHKADCNWFSAEIEIFTKYVAVYQTKKFLYY